MHYLIHYTVLFYNQEGYCNSLHWINLAGISICMDGYHEVVISAMPIKKTAGLILLKASSCTQSHIILNILVSLFIYYCGECCLGFLYIFGHDICQRSNFQTLEIERTQPILSYSGILNVGKDN